MHWKRGKKGAKYNLVGNKVATLWENKKIGELTKDFFISMDSNGWYSKLLEDGEVYLTLKKKGNFDLSITTKEFFSGMDTIINDAYISIKSTDNNFSDAMRTYLLNVFMRKYGDYYFKDAQYFLWDNERNNMLDIYRKFNIYGVNVSLSNYILQNYVIKRLGEFANNAPSDKLRDACEQWKQSLLSYKIKDESLEVIIVDDDWDPEKEHFLEFLRPKINLSKSEQEYYDMVLTSLKNMFEKMSIDTLTPGQFTEDDLRKYNYLGDREIGQIHLTHGTYSFMLPNIIQLGGLSSIDYAKRVGGVYKLFGGESGGKGGADPYLISFWYGGKLMMGYGFATAFEYPISFIMTNTIDDINSNSCILGEKEFQDYKPKFKRNILDKRKDYRWKDKNLDGIRKSGAMNNEAIAIGHFPLKCIDAIAVPNFAIEEIKDILKQNNLTHIKVIPYFAKETK